MRVILTNQSGFWMICEKIHVHPVPTLSVETLSGRAFEFFSRCSRKYQERRRLVQFTQEGLGLLCDWRILDACSATVRKSLQVLDYIAADGAKGFDDLLSILDRLGEHGIGREVVAESQKLLWEGKQYIKSEYKLQ